MVPEFRVYSLTVLTSTDCNLGCGRKSTYLLVLAAG